MRKSNKRKPAQKRKRRSPIHPNSASQQPQKLEKSPRSRSSMVIAAMLGTVSVASSLLTILPHITIEPSGDLSNPSSISFKITNAGSVPLRDLSDDRLVCRIVITTAPTITQNPKECDMSGFHPDQPDVIMRPRLDPADHYTSGLGDKTFRFASVYQITYLNLVIRLSYYPWYFPFRQYKLFGFRSWKGDDGKLYWRDYVPDPIPSPDYFSAIKNPRYPGDIGFPL